MIRAVALDRENIEDVLELRVTAAQEELIAPIPEWIAFAAYVAGSETRALMRGETPIGLYSTIDPTMCIEDPEQFQPDCLYLWRFMIDLAHQGAGYGSQALSMIYATARARGFDGLSLTTADRKEGHALAFYEREGFAPTGRRLDDEIELVKRG